MSADIHLKTMTRDNSNEAAVDFVRSDCDDAALPSSEAKIGRESPSASTSCSRVRSFQVSWHQQSSMPSKDPPADAPRLIHVTGYFVAERRRSHDELSERQ